MKINRNFSRQLVLAGNVPIIYTTLPEVSCKYNPMKIIKNSILCKSLMQCYVDHYKYIAI